MNRFIIFILFVACCGIGLGQSLNGVVYDAATGEPLPYVSVAVSGGRYGTMTDAAGKWSLRVPAGRHRIAFSFVGYQSDTITVTSPHEMKIITKLREYARSLQEVVITARESTGPTSASRIDRDAMEHIQPTSFSDLLELLPGNLSQTPDMSRANTITLRETGTVTATGAKTATNEDYSITSLGTMFMIDGAPVNNDAGMQGVPSSSASDPEGKRNITNKGVDMRTISTDNIESVEIVRGIPSAEYGNLTSGLVNIRRIYRATPFTARFKADEYSKLFSAGKGLSIGRQVVNVDAGWLDSRTDPRDSRENYKRINASLRAHLEFGNDNSAVTALWTLGGDYTGSFDNVKVDPDLNYNKIDEFKSKYNKAAFTSTLTFYTRRLKWLETVTLYTSASYEHDKLTRRKQVSPQRASVAPTSMQEGESDGHYLIKEYISDYVSDGKPLTAFLKLSATGSGTSGPLHHTYKAGIEYQGAKNYGEGQVYDLERPLSASWTTRPRSFRSIPGLNVVSGYMEDNIRLSMGESRLDVQAGLRTQTLAGLDSRYYLSGRIHADPRLNTVFSFPAVRFCGQPLRVMIAGGYGLTTKMPTSDYLFPQVHYNDMIQLNYYDVSNPLEQSRVSLRTYIADATNYDLKAARNQKWELRVGADLGVNRLSVTFFNEKMRSGFRYSTVYDTYALRRYDASAIPAGTLAGPPDLADLPFEDLRVLDGYRRVTNGSRIDKIGIEYQINTARWNAIGTSLIINGAWFRSRYSNSQMLYSPVSDVVGSTPVSERYVGLYATDDGRINEQFNTNFMFDTRIPRWGLIFSTSIQCMWFVKTTRLRDNGTPSFYLSSADGLIHPFTHADTEDVMKQYLVKHYNEAAYATQTVSPAIYLNLKATKKIGRALRVSAFVNRIVDYLPDYKSNGLTIRRTSSAYFGMEANLSF